jgi:peptidoglycan-N-acetylglucosamine deacetylase
VKICSVTVDVDCLRSNFKGFGLQKEEYSFREFRIGIENILTFFYRFNIKATFFFVAKDLEIRENAALIKDLTAKGHEVASHSYSHPQGFRFLSEKEKTEELKRSKEILENVSGQNVTGFRAPGWNISDDTLTVLRRSGYKYDSSVFPTFFTLPLKILHFIAMRQRDAMTRTTLGEWYYLFSPSEPYQTEEKKLGKRGNSGFTEFPVQVAGFLRLPFFSTIHLSYPGLFDLGYRSVRKRSIINYQMHLSDFVDYNDKEFAQEVPQQKGSYRPLSLKAALADKMRIWEKVFTAIATDYRYDTLRQVLTTL